MRIIEDLNIMNKERISNLRCYLLTIESEYIPEAYEDDNYYLIKYNILDLESLEQIIINEQVKKIDINKPIIEPLYNIIHEYHPHLTQEFNYYALIKNGWLQEKYFFESIPLKESINSLNDLLIIPNTNKAILHYFKEIKNQLEYISTSIEEHGLSNNNNLEQILNSLNSSNYLAQF